MIWCHLSPAIPGGSVLGCLSPFIVCREKIVPESTRVISIWSLKDPLSSAKLDRGLITKRGQPHYFIWEGHKTSSEARTFAVVPLDEWDIHPSAVRRNERRCHQSSLALPNAFSTTFCLAAAAARSSSSTRMPDYEWLDLTFIHTQGRSRHRAFGKVICPSSKITKDSGSIMHGIMCCVSSCYRTEFVTKVLSLLKCKLNRLTVSWPYQMNKNKGSQASGVEESGIIKNYA